MGGDDIQARERCRDRVQPDRSGIVQPNALPARLAGADAAGPGVEEHNKAELLALLVEWPERLVVRCEGLKRGMELHALEPEVGDPVELGDGAVTLERVDTAEPGE